MSSDEEISDFEVDSLSSSGSFEVKNSSFESLTANDIANLMNQYVKDVNSVVQLKETTTRILLGHTKWDKQELLDKLTEEDREQFFAKARVTNPFLEKPVAKRSTRHKKITCSICFSDCSQAEIAGLGCDHEYCKDCWCQYLTIKISSDGDAESICCPGEKCDLIVDDVTIMELVSDVAVREKYQLLICNSFVEHNPSLRWCPSPGCSLAIKVNRLLANQQKCICHCGYIFCFQCGDECHDPIPCTLMAKWKANDSDATIEYITKYTKNCPKCHSLIEKNGGCNHMTCRKCTYEFCWLCFQNWKKHNMNDCSSFRASGNGKEVDDRKRWEHYLKMYSLHKKSLKYEQELKTSTEIKEKMDSMQNSGISYNEVQFVINAIDILCESRKQIMLACIFAFCVETHNQKSIFEINQRDLSKATEELSEYLERDITKDNVDDIKQKVLNKSNYCKLRQVAMQEHIYEGFDKNWWTFSSQHF